MTGKRRARTTGGQTKVQRAATQTTLKGLFQKTNPATGPAEKAQDPHERTEPVVHSAPPSDSHPPTPPRRPKPSQLYPIFTKVSSFPSKPRDRVINLDDTEVIDITDISSDIDPSTEPYLSSTLLSPRSEFSHATEHSPPPSPTALGIHQCASATSLPHVGTHEPTCTDAGRNEGFNERFQGLGGVAPFPSSCSQHVRGLQHSYASRPGPVRRRVSLRSCPPSDVQLDFLKKCEQHREEYLRSLSHDYKDSHPAFAQISIHSENTPARHAEMWTRRFRPRRANEVLGNEQHAIYLRDWLSALELHMRDGRPEEEAPSKGTTSRENRGKGVSKREPRGVKRPRVIRTVAKRRGNKKRRVDSDDDLDGFVIWSDEDEEQGDEPMEESEDELAFCRRTYARLHGEDTSDVQEVDPVPAAGVHTTTCQSHELAGTDFDGHLTNTLLITGPPGCGKTAAVYACAEELGWEVFEVYPGIGRRNGANLEHLVGDVGRNHIVQTVHRRAPTQGGKSSGKGTTGLRGYLSKGGKEESGGAQGWEAGTEGEAMSVEGEGERDERQVGGTEGKVDSPGGADISGAWVSGSGGSRGSVGQSVVLLEEVDILFKEDGGFWGAVVELIERCRRPVVMTCNDLGLVPVGDLPLQRVLVFEPCPSSVAATFLECLSLSGGWHVPHEDLMALYESTDWTDGETGPDGTPQPRAEPVGTRDLRRSITQLQMMCAGGGHGSASEMHQGEEAEGHVRRSGGAISAARQGDMAEREMWRKMRRESELKSHVEAELCRAPRGRVERGGTEETGYVVLCGGEGLAEGLIGEEAIRESRGGHEGRGPGPIGGRMIDPGCARVAYRARMGDALEGIVGGPGGGAGVFLDYIPWVRQMVVVEDGLETRGWGRRTRNSARAGRVVGRSDGQRAVLRESGLI